MSSLEFRAWTLRNVCFRLRESYAGGHYVQQIESLLAEVVSVTLNASVTTTEVELLQRDVNQLSYAIKAERAQVTRRIEFIKYLYGRCLLTPGVWLDRHIRVQKVSADQKSLWVDFNANGHLGEKRCVVKYTLRKNGVWVKWRWPMSDKDDSTLVFNFVDWAVHDAVDDHLPVLGVVGLVLSYVPSHLQSVHECVWNWVVP